MNPKDMLWYFAHPFTAPTVGGEELNFEKCKVRTVQLLNFGLKVYSPVVHSYYLQGVNDNSFDFWLSFDKAIVDRCDGLIVAPKWMNSRGCNLEFDWFFKDRKPIVTFDRIMTFIHDEAGLWKWLEKRVNL